MEVMNKKRGGFTLIEVMIATVMLGIAIGASLNALSVYADHIGLMQNRYRSHLVAWNVLAAGLIRNEKNKLEEMGEGGDEEIAGTSWSWSTNEIEPGGEEVSTKLVRYEVEVTSGDDLSDRPVSVLRVYRPAP